ncbi:MAG: S41 family peptidase [Anaerolineae bacterium]
MSHANGCKVALFVLLIALISGSLGFVAGFMTHTILIASEDIGAATTLAPAPTTPLPSATEPLSSPSPEPTPVPGPTVSRTPTLGQTFDLFWEVWDLVEKDYYGALPQAEEVTYGAIRGALNTLGDPFTGFIEPEMAAIQREDDSGAFEGIGAYVTMREGRLIIVNTFKGQPAEQAGLRRGDIVLKVDDVPIENMSIYEAISLIRGPQGTRVRLTILREGEEPFEVEIVRARIEIPVVESQMREDGIGYLRLLDFSADASAKLTEALRTFLVQNPKGLILDLRGNPGGYFQEAVLTAGLFLPKGQVVVIERYKNAPPEVVRTPNEPVAPDIPLVVLVDGGSASASEIVAGALQDLGRATIIGEQTFGKGAVQLRYQLSDGSELLVTVARWFTPNDRAIHGEGLAPDIPVEVTLEEMEAGRDPQLERAAEYLLKGQ